MSYGYLGSIRARPGQRDHVVEILLRGADGLRAAGCEFYIVSLALSDPDVIWVSEVWLSKKHHDEALELAEAKLAIAEALPLLTGEFTSQELSVVGGLGV